MTEERQRLNRCPSYTRTSTKINFWYSKMFLALPKALLDFNLSLRTAVGGDQTTGGGKVESETGRISGMTNGYGGGHGYSHHGYPPQSYPPPPPTVYPPQYGYTEPGYYASHGGYPPTGYPGGHGSSSHHGGGAAAAYGAHKLSGHDHGQGGYGGYVHGYDGHCYGELHDKFKKWE